MTTWFLFLVTIFKLKNLEFPWFDFFLFRIYKDKCTNFKPMEKVPISPLYVIKKFRFELTVLVLTLIKMVLCIVDTKDYFVD